MNILSLALYITAVLAMLFTGYKRTVTHMIVIGFVWTIGCIIVGWDWFFIGHAIALAVAIDEVNDDNY